jgi:hypothetical protein
MLALVALLAGCGTAPVPPKPAGTERWQAARKELVSLRERLSPARPYRMNVTLELQQKSLAARMRARGAVAVRPPDALRMLLLGPGGTTALDLWVCRDRFRFAIPAVDLVRRGDASTPAHELRGLPVAFLRWWFLSPLEGRLLSFVDEAAGRRYVMRQDDQVTHLSVVEEGLRVRRVSRGDEESLVSDGRACGKVRYQQKSTGIELEVQCEELDDDTAPPERAFADPDDASRMCGERP